MANTTNTTTTTATAKQVAAVSKNPKQKSAKKDIPKNTGT
jgi:hypothetical protein